MMGAVPPKPRFPIVDVHTHLMPERLFRAVRAYFHQQLWRPLYDGPTEELVAKRVSAGVSRFVFMPYAHRGEMARSLNHWVANVQATFAPLGIGELVGVTDQLIVSRALPARAIIPALAHEHVQKSIGVIVIADPAGGTQVIIQTGLSVVEDFPFDLPQFNGNPQLVPPHLL